MAIDMSLVKKLREKTSIGIMECKDALNEANGDFDKAIDILRKRGYEKAKSKSSRVTKQGIIASYIHANLKIGVLLELGCETDFVAKNEDFLALAKEITLQIAAMNPTYVSSNEIPEDELEKEKEIYREQLKKSGKPDNIVDKIVEGKLNKFYSDVCLLDQKFFKDEKKSMENLITETIHKIGENIVVKRFIRYQLGEEN